MKFSISLLALCSAASALTVAVPRNFPPTNIAKVIDASTLIGWNATVTETEKRAQGTVFLCNAAFFSGYCVAITGEFDGGCIDLAADLDNQVSSFGPDQGQRCQLFNAHGCATSGAGTPAWSGPIAFPGIQDFSVSWVDADGKVNAPFNDIISSYRCTW
ncbi:hypothetical protein DFH09DRAFT_1174736 [Mycena vulgaris]|nr:hypothetical protein DFH09DRAFT_1174729 [Mycena vulgaris]KAJ6541197.1 hypothetical protein DFH09DRAFT_1174736 [Mycena vulgaris]